MTLRAKGEAVRRPPGPGCSGFGFRGRGRAGFTLIEVLGALVVFSAGILMLLGLTGVLSLQVSLSAQRSEVSVEVQNRLDSLLSVPYDSLGLGSRSDTVVFQGRTFVRTQMVLQAAPLVREVQVTLKPEVGTGPEAAASAFVQHPW